MYCMSAVAVLRLIWTTKDTQWCGGVCMAGLCLLCGGACACCVVGPVLVVWCGLSLLCGGACACCVV